MAEKRPLEATQNGESFAVCYKCNRVSNNVTTCEKCGTALTKDNSAECFSSEPKRQRLESGSSPGVAERESLSNGSTNTSNGVGTPTPANLPRALSANPARASLPGASPNMNPVQPVPQQLYMNTMNAASLPAAVNTIPQLPAPPPGVSLAGPRPQQLYLNVSNPGVYPPTLMQVPASSTPASTTNLMASTNGSVSPAIRPSHPTLTSSIGMQLGGMATQRPQLPAGAQDPPRSAGQSVLAAAGLATSTLAPPPAYARPAVQQAPPPNIPQKFYINVQQIRIGLRGFAPASTVQFKDDGVLFTLKEYPNAPLLLNIRAIMKCRANLTGPFQALFFYLESSCIKQIRTIFHMKEFEFNEKSNIDKVKCVAVLPSSLAQREAKMIENIFSVMKTSAQRPEPILELVTPEDVLDILYGTWSSVNDIFTAQREAGQTNNHSNSNSPATIRGPPSQLPTASQILNTSSQMANSTRTNTVANALANNRHVMATGMPPRAGAPPANQQVPTGPNGGLPPTLVIPTDSARWQQMKKSLMVGGVYQVQMQNGQRKYCLWNGTELLPCLVQDTEVQLKCTHIRIGSLKVAATSHVKVQNDANNRGISVKFSHEDRPVNLFIPQSGITDCLLCTEHSFQALFLYTTQTVSNKICSQCNMSNWQNDPYYSTSSRKERQRHLILFLKDVNADQKEALLQIKSNAMNPPRRLVQEISVMRSLEILSAIKANSMVQSKIDDYIGGPKALPKPSITELDSLVRYVSGKDIEDDDDDVIMTQEEIGIKCPYTQQVMKEPVKNMRCSHNYEKAAILEFIQRKKAKNIEAKCPYAGCGNQVPLRISDLKDNIELKNYIATLPNKS